jgi:cell division protein FtsQ
MRVLPLAALALGLAALFAVARPDLALVEQVEFQGAERCSPVALRHLVDIRNGTTMWGVDLRRAERGAEAHPWVQSARAYRKLPNAVVVEVEEYEPVALLHRDGLFYVDRSGAVFLRARTDELDYPVITGIDEALERAHPDLPRLVLRDTLWLLDALDSRGLVSRARVSEVAFSRTRGFTTHLGGGAELRFGLEGLDRQVDRLSVLLAEGVDLGQPVLVDLAPASVAIVRPLGARGEG